MFRASVTMNMSQRINEPLVHCPAPVTFNVSQVAGRPELFGDESVRVAFNVCRRLMQPSTLFAWQDCAQIIQIIALKRC